MVVFILLNFLVSDFQQKWYIPQGIDWGASRIVISDTDRDNNYEFIFSTYGDWPIARIYFYELHLPDTWEVDSVPYLNAPLLWDIGDFDIDGLCDLAMQCGSTNPFWVGITVFESPDSFSYPTQEVWRDTVGPPLVLPISAYDIDQDGYSEIVKMGGDLDTAHYTDFLIYESIDDNIYSVTYTIATETSPTSTVAFGDFDQDTFNEFVMGTIDGEYSVFESPDDNTYEARILNQQLSTVNIKDCFSVPDADGDGKLEFGVKGFTPLDARTHAFIFEAIGDNTYEIIKSFNLAGGDYYGGYSEAGDVDGDSIPEIVLESASYVYIIKAAGNDSFYVWDTLPGHASGSCVRIFDIDDNGLSEIIISGNDETRIYEYELGIEEEAGFGIPTSGFGLQVYPNPIHKKCNIKYVLPQHSNVNVSLFDVTGRLIREIVNEKQIGGVYYKTFDMTDLPQGIYFFRLETRDYKETRKAILLK